MFANMKRADTPKENRTGRMTRLSDIIVGRVLPGIRRRHEEFSAPASSDRSARDMRERPADEWGAAAGAYTPTAAGEPVDLGEEEGTVARQYGMKTADHLAPPSSAATAASNFARQSASCS